jgi:hypothetical protein
MAVKILKIQFFLNIFFCVLHTVLYFCNLISSLFKITAVLHLLFNPLYLGTQDMFKRLSLLIAYVL